MNRDRGWVGVRVPGGILVVGVDANVCVVVDISIYWGG